jgi:hypothetical protein
MRNCPYLLMKLRTDICVWSFQGGCGVKEGALEEDDWGRNRKGREEEGRWRDRMRWDGDGAGDEARARAEVRLRMALFFFCLPRHRRHLFGSPALVTEHPLPFLSLFSYPFHPLSSFQTLPVPRPCCTVCINHCNRTPQSRNPHRDPRSGKIRSNPVHTHGLSNYPSFILQRLLVALPSYASRHLPERQQ